MRIGTAVASPWPAGTPAFLPVETHVGTGDGVAVTDWPPRPGIVTFDCRVPSGNVAVETDGNESVLVNTIGSYTGSRWINIHENTHTRTFLITAPGPWKLTIGDLDSLEPAGHDASGAGDAVLYLSEETSRAIVTHEGGGNFIVEVASAAVERIDLVVNEIGPFHDIVPLIGPALVQVTSSGKWRITGGHADTRGRGNERPAPRGIAVQGG